MAEPYALAQRLLENRTPDMRAYITLLREAADSGHTRALENLGSWFLEGLCDDDGWIVRKNPRKGVSLLLRAAQEGDALACFTLGNCYDEGIGVRKDRTAAKKYFAKAYRGGVALGAMNLAALAAEGGNAKLELAWLRRAREAGEADATIALAERAFLRGWSGRRFAELVPELKKLARKQVPEAEDAKELLQRARSRGFV